MNNAELVPLVKETMINAALAFEIHNGKGDQWRRVFKQAINDLPVKAGRQYRQLVAWSEMSKEAMDKVCGTIVSTLR